MARTKTAAPVVLSSENIVKLGDVRHRIRVNDKTQPRDGMDVKHIARLRDALDKEKTYRDPLEGVYDPVTTYIYLFIGFHRLAASKEGCGECYDALIRLHFPEQGVAAERDAFLHSLVNPSSGFGAKPESKADHRHRIKIALEDSELRKLPNESLARYLGENTATVRYYRKLFELQAPQTIVVAEAE